MSQLPPTIHESWHEYLQPLFDDVKMQMIKDTLVFPYYPSPDLVFRVFRMPIDKIKVVILGQDPYPNGEAIGVAFGVAKTTPVPASLRIILKEIIRSEALMGEDSDRTLQAWIQQGVFLLNTALTVEARNSGSHVEIWRWWTRQIVAIISKVNPCVWLLWGSKAQMFKSYISNYYTQSHQIIIDSTNIEANWVLECPHPAAESYNPDTPYKFTGCNHFNLCNEILKEKGLETIKW